MVQPLPAAQYNNLPKGDELSLPPLEALRQLGEIIISHGMSAQLGISLLHRHFELTPGEIMFHNGLQCSPKLAHINMQLNAASLYLHDGHLKAFEFGSDEEVSMSERFVNDMVSYLSQTGLGQAVALTRLNKKY